MAWRAEDDLQSECRAGQTCYHIRYVQTYMVDMDLRLRIPVPIPIPVYEYGVRPLPEESIGGQGVRYARTKAGLPHDRGVSFVPWIMRTGDERHGGRESRSEGGSSHRLGDMAKLGPGGSEKTKVRGTKRVGSS